MKWFRTIPGFVRLLVTLFMVAQLAGLVSSPLVSAQGIPTAVASHVHDHHADDHGGQGTFHHHGDQSGSHADYCCALHAFFAGVLPPVIAVETMDVVGQRLTAAVADVSFGVAPGRLDRPPRSFAVI